MKRLERSRKVLGRMVVAGALLTGCATVQVQQPPERPPAPSASATKKQAENPREVCLRKLSGIQECLVETAIKGCKGQGEDKSACISKELHQKLEFPGKQRALSVIVKNGGEVLSMTVGEFVLISIVKVQAVSVDEKGVDFQYAHSQSETENLADQKRLVEFNFRVNFDGTTSGDIWKLRGLEIWNFKVAPVADGARVTFSTMDNRIMVRQ